jgi:hypothetical protein
LARANRDTGSTTIQELDYCYDLYEPVTVKRDWLDRYGEGNVILLGASSRYKRKPKV